MELNVQERFALQNVLPQQGNFVKMQLLSKLRDAIAVTEDEIKQYGIVFEGPQVKWNPESAAETKEIAIGDTTKGLIVEALKKLDADGQLTVAHLTLYEKFVQ